MPAKLKSEYALNLTTNCDFSHLFDEECTAANAPYFEIRRAVRLELGAISNPNDLEIMHITNFPRHSDCLGTFCIAYNDIITQDLQAVPSIVHDDERAMDPYIHHKQIAGCDLPQSKDPESLSAVHNAPSSPTSCISDPACVQMRSR